MIKYCHETVLYYWDKLIQYFLEKYLAPGAIKMVNTFDDNS